MTSVRLICAIAVLLLSSLNTIALAQGRRADVASGLQFAETWCSGCHPIQLRSARSGGIAPDFRTVANWSWTTEASLTAFLNSDHNIMPNFRLTQEETRDIVAYILSLKGK